MFNTPSHHRVHHASDPDYLDTNYGGILIIWDRLFGSYAEETHRPTYGLTKNVDSFNPFRLQYHEYAAIARDVRRLVAGASGSATCSVRPDGRRTRPASRSRASTLQRPDQKNARLSRPTSRAPPAIRRSPRRCSGARPPGSPS